MENVENPILNEVVENNSDLKRLFVNYVGNKLKPKDGDVTVEMVVEVLSQEFPEFLMVIAEENFIRGYQQAFLDIESSPKK
jgi:hypothetical protein